uniref:NME/NM23 family member 8 n=1 Tax=Malurus cyaneus samueli TaxID=2593467 RepID=A0A8C5X7P6_9PASS
KMLKYEWDEMLQTQGIVVIDVYQSWCGPCKAVLNLLRKLRIDFSDDDVLHFAVAEADNLECLKPFRKSCEPVFLFCVYGKIVAIVRGVNAPLITKTVTDLVLVERKIAAGEQERGEHHCLISDDKFRVPAPDFEEFVEFMMSGPCHVLIITRSLTTGDIPHWKGLDDKSESAESLVNICDVQDSVEDASRQLAFFFPNFNVNEEEHVERTLAIIRPSLLKERRDSIIQRIKDDGFRIAMQKEIMLSEDQVRTFYKEHVDQDYFPVLLDQMTSGPTLVLALTGENAVSHWRNLLGPKTLEEAKENPESLRARYAIDSVPINQLHGSSSAVDAEKELEFFFPEEKTFALIKPDAAKTHKEEIMKRVKQAGFSISKVKEQALTREMAAQFYKDHEGKPFFEDLVNCMTAGPSVVMVLSKENAVEEWRQLMGPTDPEEAKKVSPESIRAQFAHDILSNAVHGSSNPEHAMKSIAFAFGELDAD